MNLFSWHHRWIQKMPNGTWTLLVSTTHTSMVLVYSAPGVWSTRPRSGILCRGWHRWNRLPWRSIRRYLAINVRPSLLSEVCICLFLFFYISLFCLKNDVTLSSILHISYLRQWCSCHTCQLLLFSGFLDPQNRSIFHIFRRRKNPFNFSS